MTCGAYLISVSNGRYYTGYPREERVSRVLEFKSERQFVELLHQGEPVAVAFTLKYFEICHGLSVLHFLLIVLLFCGLWNNRLLLLR